VVVDNGLVYIGGQTFGSGFPTTAGAYQTTFGGGGFAADGFLVVIDPAGNGSSDLVYSTFLGTSAGERIESVAFDGQYIHAVGQTSSSVFPTTPGAYDESGNGSMLYIVLDPSGNGSSDLVYSSYFGGNGTTTPWKMVLEDGVAYVVGLTTSSDFAVTPDAFDSVFNGDNDAFLIQFEASGNGADDLLYSTYVGSTSSDVFRGVAIEDGYVYAGGFTTSPADRLSAFSFEGSPYDDSVSDGAD